MLGHEVGHVVNRHSAQQMATGQLGQMLTLAFGIGASGNGDSGQRAQMIAMMVNKMTQLKFSREDESEADSFGLKYMAQTGYDPTAMLDVMKILEDASKGGGRQPEFLATHPAPANRAEAIKEILQNEYANKIPAQLTRGRPLHSGGPAVNTRYAP